GEKRQDRENLPGDAKRAPGLLGLVVTRARQRTCYSINEAARTSTRRTPSSESKLCGQARRELPGKEKRRRPILLSLHLLTRFGELQAPVTRNRCGNDKEDLHQHQGAMEAAERQQRLCQAEETHSHPPDKKLSKNETLRLAMRYINFLVKVLGEPGLQQTAAAARGSLLGFFQQAPRLQSMEELALVESCGASSPGGSSNIAECCWPETLSP
uniref:TAL bHLH transcription factor 2 n=1 Tax=Anas zonorhyncha TaxID=75864 RepID=A0A8B9UNV2_9AVES